MDIFSKIRKATQFTSLVISSIIFIIALYGIATHNDLYFEIGLLLIGFIIAGGLLLSPILGRFWCGWMCPRGTSVKGIQIVHGFDNGSDVRHGSYGYESAAYS